MAGFSLLPSYVLALGFPVVGGIVILVLKAVLCEHTVYPLDLTLDCNCAYSKLLPGHSGERLMHAHATKRTKGSKFSIRALLLKQGGPTRRQYSFHPTHSVLRRCVREWGCVPVVH